MRMSWLSCIITGLAVTLSVTGCSSKSTNDTGGSGLGESCQRSLDCNSPLVCIAGACVTKGTTPMDASVPPMDSGHPTMDSSMPPQDTNTPPPPAPGAPADTGTPPADTGTPPVDTGPGNIDTGPLPPPGGGASLLDQSCTSTSDCASGLVCESRSAAAGGPVCDLASYGLTPTGKACVGECVTADDCCELPVGITLRSTTTNQPVAIHQCQDILQTVLNGSASACAQMPAPGSATGIACFYYQTYCNCGAMTWACTNNACSYTGSCSVNAATPELGGCPNETRTGSALNTNCNTTANVCESTVTGQCMQDSDCVDGTVVADTPGATCRGSDCTCYKTSCYLKCAQDIDCTQGYSCDATTKLCETAPACTTNQECAERLINVLATCSNGECGIPCTNDHDCSPSGAIPSLGAFNGTVCGGSGVCETVGCTSDADCPATGSDVHVFCVTAGTGTAANLAHSALTN